MAVEVEYGDCMRVWSHASLVDLPSHSSRSPFQWHSVQWTLVRLTSQSLQTNEKSVQGVVYEIEDDVNIDRYKPPFVDADATSNATNPFGLCVCVYIYI